MTADAARVTAAIEVVLAEARRDALRFGIGIVVATPGVVGIFLFAVFVAGAHLGLGENARTALPYVGVDLLFAWLSFVTLVQKRGHFGLEQRLAVLALCSLLALSFVTPRIASAPGTFALLYAANAFVLLGLLGRVYVPKDRYDVGTHGADDPMRIEDDLDRQHAMLGFLVAIPNFLLSGYAEIFGSHKLWATADARSAARLLVALAAFPRPLASLGADESAAATLLRRLELARVTGSKLEITGVGKDLIATA